MQKTQCKLGDEFHFMAVVGVEGWELEGLNVSGVTCGNCGKRKHKGIAWAKGQWLDSGWDWGTLEGFRRLCSTRDWRNF